MSDMAASLQKPPDVAIVEPFKRPVGEFNLATAPRRRHNHIKLTVIRIGKEGFLRSTTMTQYNEHHLSRKQREPSLRPYQLLLMTAGSRPLTQLKAHFTRAS
jgi:hypothetical protein